MCYIQVYLAFLAAERKKCCCGTASEPLLFSSHAVLEQKAVLNVRESDEASHSNFKVKTKQKSIKETAKYDTYSKRQMKQCVKHLTEKGLLGYSSPFK